jgi:hydroxymethylglutaryl-CoA reductase (NADPH)
VLGGRRDHVKAAPLWEALPDFVANALRERGGDRLLRWQRCAVSSLQPSQDEALRMPSTLIHNDFNPRNLCFRREHRALRVCAYDWELATVALPQTDLVVLLCYVLPQDDAGDALTRASDAHRHTLERAVDASIDPLRWEAGLRLALQILLATRLPSYLMLDRVRAQTWLLGVLTHAERLGENLALPD